MTKSEKLKRAIRNEIKTVISEASVSIPGDEAILDKVIGKWAAKMAAAVANHVIRQIGSKAGITINHKPTITSGAGFVSLTGYTRSDIEAKVEISVIHIPRNNEVLLEVSLDQRPYAAETRKFEFRMGESAVPHLTNAANHIITVFYGY